MVAALIAAVLLYANGHDGPIEIIAGGEFQTGEVVEAEPDWSEFKDHETAELQLLTPPQSRLLWIAVFDNKPYILSSFMNTGYGKVWKHWPLQAEEDPRALLRIEGKIYARELVRLDEAEVPDGVIDEFNHKYGLGLDREGITNGSTWVYFLAPR